MLDSMSAPHRASWRMPILVLLTCVVPLAVLPSCSDAEPAPNPALPGFRASESDPEAIAVADRVMRRLGGRAAWDATRYLSWTLDDRRILWDRHAGRARVELGPRVAIIDTGQPSGRVWKRDGSELEGAAASAHVQQAHQAFVNDSYWLVMPYKLKDTGVKLESLGQRISTAGESCDVLGLSFQKVGYTPYNRLEVYVDRATDLVAQWDFFLRRVDARPTFSTPWRRWRRFGRIWLSESRGERRFEDLRVFDELPPEAFDGAAPFDPSAHTPSPRS